MMEVEKDNIEGKTIAISGYGNVGTFAIEKVNELGGKVVTIADEHGYVYRRWHQRRKIGIFERPVVRLSEMRKRLCG